MEHRVTLAERQITLVLRYLHMCGGTLYDEKLPLHGAALSPMMRQNLVTFTRLDGTELSRAWYSQVSITALGLDWLKQRGCLTYGREERRGWNLWDQDLSLFLLQDKLPE